NVTDEKLADVGQGIAERLQALGEKCRRLFDEKVQGAETPLSEVEKSAREAATLARHLEGWAVAYHFTGTIDPVGVYRKYALHRFLVHQARRTYLDHWDGVREKPDDKPYYREAAEVYLADAQDLLLLAVGPKGGGESDKRLAPLTEAKLALAKAKKL